MTRPTTQASLLSRVRALIGDRFWVGLGLIGALGLVWRVLYVLLFTRYEDSAFYDDIWYELQAKNLAAGHFFDVVLSCTQTGARVQTCTTAHLHGFDAAHPPLTSIVITPVTWLFGLSASATPQRLTMAVLGAAIVVVVGLLGRALAGPGVGLLAAVVAAAYPNIWIQNGIVMSETLAMLLVGLALLATYRLLRAPSWGNAALLGVCCGLAMLARSELFLLVPCLLVPAALVATGATWRQRWAMAAVGMVVAGLVVGPWVGRNLATFSDTTLLSTGEGPILAGANCATTYETPNLGFWSNYCAFVGGKCPPAQQATSCSATLSVLASRQETAGLHYARQHLSQVPVVVLARIGRLWDFYEPLQQTKDLATPQPADLMGLFSYYLLLPAALFGALVLRRRRVRIWPLLVIAGVVTLVAATADGGVRFRATFEVPLVVLAAVGLEGAWRWLRDRQLEPANADAS